MVSRISDFDSSLRRDPLDELELVGPSEFGLRQLCEVRERLPLRRVEVAGPSIDGAQRPHGKARGVADDLTGVEADVGCPEDEGVVGEAIVVCSVLDDEQRAAVGDRMTAEGDLPGGLARVEADPRLEPLTITIDERYQRDGHVEDARGEPDDAIETILDGGVEDAECLECAEALVLVLMEPRWDHPRAHRQRPRGVEFPAGTDTGSHVGSCPDGGVRRTATRGRHPSRRRHPPADVMMLRCGAP